MLYTAFYVFIITCKSVGSIGFRWVEMDLARVQKAIDEGKVFEMRGDVTSGTVSAREFLLARGWVEKTKWAPPPAPQGSQFFQKSDLPPPPFHKPNASFPSKNEQNSKPGLSTPATSTSTATNTKLNNPAVKTSSPKIEPNANSKQNSQQQNNQNNQNTNHNFNNNQNSTQNSNQNPSPITLSKSTTIKINEESSEIKALRLLYDTAANLIWADCACVVRWSQCLPTQLVNMHPQDDYLLKKNLIDPIRDLHWIAAEDNTCITAFPRTYRLYIEEEQNQFIHDYRLTACMSLLKWFVNCMEYDTTDGVEDQKTSEILFPLVKFSILQVMNYVRIRKHEDIDDPVKNVKPSSSSSSSSIVDWEKFLSQSYQLTHRKTKFKPTPTDEAQSLYKPSTRALVDVQPFWPQSQIDGIRNVWIFKPGEGMRGVGIVIMDKYDEIAKKFLTPETLKTTWVVQKYIEKPLLVFKTKIDMRQWYLITSWNPLTVFIYKRSYVRFSSTTFSMDDLRQQIHLTNNTLQAQYKIDANRDPSLPTTNMWTNTDFQNYLRRIGRPEVWSTIIFPRIKQVILAVLLAARHFIIDRPNSFTIQGVDFMFSEDFKPWLLEINATPLLTNFNSVAAKLCPGCVQDALKVVLDWKNGEKPDADTGDFEILYIEKKPLLPSISALNSPIDQKNQNQNQNSGQNLNDPFLIKGVKVPIISERERRDT